jgi:hypothetical protein
MDIEKKDEGLNAADADSWTLPQPIAIYLWSSAFFTFLCAALILFWRAHHWPYPYNTVFMPDALCRDLWCYKPQFLELHTVNFFRPRQEELFPYPPGSVLPFILFQNILPEFHSIPYIGLTLLGVVGLAILLIQGIVRLGVGRQKASVLVAVAATLMFPFWFVWSTGNIEIFLFLALSCSIIAFLRGKLLLAAVLIGFCASMKLYPFIFVALFLSIKRYREMVVAAGSFVLFTLMGLWFMTPHLQLSWEGTRAAMKANRSGTMQTFFPIQSSADHAL